MSDIIEIPRYDGTDAMEPPYWADTFNPSGARIRPHIYCKCGEGTNIGNHHIHPDGTITASYLHQLPDGGGCGWHVYLKMKDWDGGELKPGENKVKV